MRSPRSARACTWIAGMVLWAGSCPAQGDLTGGGQPGPAIVVHRLPPPVSVTNPTPRVEPEDRSAEFDAVALAGPAAPAPAAAAPAAAAALHASVQPARIAPGGRGTVHLVVALAGDAILESAARLRVELVEGSGSLRFQPWVLLPAPAATRARARLGRAVHDDTATILVPCSVEEGAREGTYGIEVRVRADLHAGSTAAPLGTWEGRAHAAVRVAADPMAPVATPARLVPAPEVEDPGAPGSTSSAQPAPLEPAGNSGRLGLILVAAGFAAVLLLLVRRRLHG